MTIEEKLSLLQNLRNVEYNLNNSLLFGIINKIDIMNALGATFYDVNQDEICLPSNLLDYEIEVDLVFTGCPTVIILKISLRHPDEEAWKDYYSEHLSCGILARDLTEESIKKIIFS